jgi:hypothetical protein
MMNIFKKEECTIMEEHVQKIIIEIQKTNSHRPNFEAA